MRRPLAAAPFAATGCHRVPPPVDGLPPADEKERPLLRGVDRETIRILNEEAESFS